MKQIKIKEEDFERLIQYGNAGEPIWMAMKRVLDGDEQKDLASEILCEIADNLLDLISDIDDAGHAGNQTLKYVKRKIEEIVKRVEETKLVYKVN